ncbi:F0F1 ATP synthase subunit B [Aerococcaceae bacterium zg-ZJ1578]|uniref:F0F1 ATP synthase subunit B n=1 Tax=Aerococcaceae TaxID=186827 RepID=UPI0013B6B6D8|nr:MULTISPECIES: F0F1 ATP synthase subunit B [unclassified Facklamia]MBK0348182.1 F0F1 ATP synthase subunit B [Aerococcaceae bacterium zg-1578]MBS4462419.1 F0F1 ATP synthase subunit B [Aerococcaceae bacterium zg-B36]QQD66095.1 F0F1 ATP synthase subunit B [Aerococcaceae bacterium zg-252]NEW64931.1 F0F1 ATP synthase subunit B [Facklamia sp. 252]NEW68253.1 F0F1 ATP synthase subunit B [Facklamia sp. 253]
MFVALLLTTTESPNTALGNTIVTMVAFVILLLIVKHFTWQPFMKTLGKRHQIIQDDLADAAHAKEESIKAKQEAQQLLKDARHEATQIIMNAKKQALQVQDTMIKDAKEDIARMREAAEQEAAQERTRILNEVKGELTDIAIEIAEKILHREITNADYHRLVEEFIHGMDDLT